MIPLLKLIRSYKYLFLILVLFTFLSCTPRKKQVYLSKGETSGVSTKEHSINSYKLQEGDILYVKILTLDEKTYKLFNSEFSSGSNRSETNFLLDGYTVSETGHVDLPIIRQIKVVGLSLEEAQKEIQKQIDGFLLDAVVLVKLINYKITVLGEVNRPGTFKILDNKINVLEAISLAGDLTVFGDREKIMVLRKSENNKIAYLDITNINVINSEFFHLKPDDVLYIEPTMAKTLGFKEFPFSILFSSITTVIVLINFLSK